MKSIYKAAIIIPVITMLLVPIMAMAADELKPAPIESLQGVQNLLSNILTWLNTIFYIVAAIFILIAAFAYLTAGGNEDKIKTAKRMLLYAVIAIAIALFAGGLDRLVFNVLTY